MNQQFVTLRLMLLVVVSSMLWNVFGYSQSTELSEDDAKQSFELKVVDENARPVPGAAVVIRCRPKMDASQIVVGTVQEANSYGIETIADENGTIRLQAKSFQVT